MFIHSSQSSVVDAAQQYLVLVKSFTFGPATWNASCLLAAAGNDVTPATFSVFFIESLER